MDHTAPPSESLLLQAHRFLQQETNCGFLRRDAAGRILEVNERLCELLEKVHEELIGRAANDVVADLQTSTDSYEADLVSTSGIQRRVLITTAPLVLNGTIVGYVDSLVDITGHRAMKLKLVEEVQFMSRLASTDGLTGLSNRNAFLEALSRSLDLESNCPLAVVIADLDHFKAINDRFGHAAGDEALVQFARKLSSAVRESDVVARLGGDEFAVLLPKAAFSIASDIFGRLMDKLQFEFEFEGNSIAVRASVGWAHSDEGTEQIMRVADERMYKEKRKSPTR
jgi:diguanylate cyclase (GGDEF)-like protein